jgi:hypothetical protein
VLHPKRAATAKVTYADVLDTVHDAEALWLMTGGLGQAVKLPGLYGGSMTAGGSGFTLKNYSITHGVTVSGLVRFTKFGPPLVFQGALTVAGTAASHGVLVLQGARLAGALGGKKVP